jgi:DNA helicase II / ATP-dependent DNA helicase PcrA
MDPALLRDLLGVPFTDEQLAAASAPLEPAVVIAGAGSGKTTVMAARVIWLVVSGQVSPEQVLGLTFTNKAAAELASRIREALRRANLTLAGNGNGTGTGPDLVATEVALEPTVATYHAYAGRLLREHGLRIGVEPSARLLADATRFQLAERALRRARGPFPELDKTVARLVGDVVQLEGELNEHLVSVDDLVAADARIVADIAAYAPGHHRGRQSVDSIKAARIAVQRTYLASIVADMRRDKERLGVIDFGDQVALAARLAVEHPVVAEVERDRFRVVLLDEYQDTSVAQKRLLVGLFGQGHPVTAVGDPCQAIYGWRGAFVGNIDAFPEEFPRLQQDGTAASSVRFGLAQNNRSGGRLLDLANGMAQRLRERHPGVAALVPRPEVATAGDAVCGLFETYEQEVRWVADTIAAEIAAGRPPSDIAVLVRVRSDFPAYHDALAARGIPVEVVGLGGLLALPEVAELVAMLGVLDDATANPDLVRLLSGPRWRIGPRDLVILGRRAVDLVRLDRRPRGATDADDSGGDDLAGRVSPGDGSVERLLEEAVAGVDPSEITSLSEALERPGRPERYPYSDQARARFGRLAAELRGLRAALGDPLLDVIHQVVAASGLDVEVGAAPGGPQARRSAALGAFLDHAAAFADLEGDPSIRAFLAYLQAAEEFERGLDTTAPSPGDSVKLLTVHKAKGLEWPVVVLPDLTAGVFPSRAGRSTWATSAALLPRDLRGDGADLPDIGDYSAKAFKAYEEELKALDSLEELRLAYVAVTRAKDLLVASSHWWGPAQLKPRGPSEYLLAIREHCEAVGRVVAWQPVPHEATNPYLRGYEQAGWPLALEPRGLAERRRAASWVREAMAGDRAGQLELELPSLAPDDGLSPAERSLVHDWDTDLAALLEEARLAHRVDLEVALPASLSASALVRLASDPTGLARDLARPMPRPPAPAATRGTRFHAWVESLFGERPLLDRFELEGAADDDLVPDDSLAALKAAFLDGPYAVVAPHRVEAPFQLVLGGAVVRGRIDAVYRTADGYDVIDWKTGSSRADPLQLAIYRVAWARIAGVPESAVGAGFYYVAQGRVDRPAPLPGADELERILTGPD